MSYKKKIVKQTKKCEKLCFFLFVRVPPRRALTVLPPANPPQAHTQEITGGQPKACVIAGFGTFWTSVVGIKTNRARGGASREPTPHGRGVDRASSTVRTHLAPRSLLEGAPSPTAFKNMPTRNGRIIPGSPLMNPIRQSLASGKNACALPPLVQDSPHLLYSYCFTLRYKLRGGEYLESHTALPSLSAADR